MDDIKLLEEIGNILSEHNTKDNQDKFIKEIINLYLKGYLERGYSKCDCCQGFFKKKELITKSDERLCLSIDVCKDCNRNEKVYETAGFKYDGVNGDLLLGVNNEIKQISNRGKEI